MLIRNEFKLFHRLAAAWLLLLIVVSIEPSMLTRQDPLALDLSNRLSPPSTRHPAGTDALGRDMLARISTAAYSSVTITTGATSLALGLGLLLGGLAGWQGGWLGRVLYFVISLFWSVPFIVLVILLIAIIGVSKWTLILAIGGINWVVSARVFRAEVERLRHSAFVRSTRALGFGSSQLLTLHIAPHLWPLIGRLAVFGAIETLSLETGLAFLGLSLPPPLPTWGGLLADGLEHLSNAWWISSIPSLIMLLTLGSLRILLKRRISPVIV